MKRLWLFAASFLICGIVAIDAFACETDVKNLTVTVENGYRITSDGSPYIGGQNKVEAMFQKGNCSMDFTMNLNFSKRYLVVDVPNADGTTKRYTSKFFNFDRIASVPITQDGNLVTKNNADGTVSQVPTNFLDTPFCTNGYDDSPDNFEVEKNSGDNTYRDNYAGCGYDADGYFVRRNVGMSLNDGTRTDWRMRFQYSPIDNTGGNTIVVGTSYIKVYHPNNKTWILVPEAPETAVLFYWDKSGQVKKGNPQMPFKIKVTIP